MNSLVEAGTTIVLAIIGLAVLSALISPKANTTNVVQSLASGLANNIGVAQSPVTGTSLSLSLGYPASNTGMSMFGN